ncbi:MAG: LysE family translocator, partial [Inhella sp.]
NPKAWMMAVAAYTTYLPARSVGTVLAVALLFALVNLPCLSTWTLLGSRLRGWMAVGRRQRLFNLSMGGLLVLSLWPMLR